MPRKTKSKPKVRKVREIAPYSEVLAAAEKMNREIRSDDRRFWRTVVMHHDDGSCATWVSAWAHEHDKDFIFIFTEHHGFFVYEREFVTVHEFEWRFKGKTVGHIQHAKTDPGPVYEIDEEPETRSAKGSRSSQKRGRT